MKSKLSILLFILSVFYFVNAHAQLSNRHFIPPLTYAETGNANPENQYFYISTPSNKDVRYTIKQIGFPSRDITGIVSRLSPKEIFIASGDSQLFVDSRQTSVVHNNKGYIVEASDVIYVSVRVLAGGGAQAGALVSKGSSALGTIFRAGMFTNENPQTNYLNFISVMASVDNTQVTFEDLPAGISIKNYSGTLPISVTLNEGESYVVATNAADNTTNRDGLIGTLITSNDSNKPIVVNTGSANGSFHNGGGRDYGIDQIVGLDKVGTEYIFVKGDGNDGWENVLIVAHEDNTTVSINGNGVTSTINKGDFTLIEGNSFNAMGNMFVKTSKPVFAYQGIGANSSEANQGMFFVPPLNCESRGKVDNIPNIESIGDVTFTGGITVVTNANASVSINSLPIKDFTAFGPFAIDIDNDGTADYETYQVTNLTGNVSVESSEELYCAYYNVNGAATSGSFYSGFPSSPEINFDTTVTTLNNCIPNVTLQAANTDLFDRFEWQYFNEATSTWEQRSTNSEYKPLESEPGRYKLIGTIDCTGATFVSIEVPVSICPDDFDDDLIIDNLDVDLDNDGILNCDESLGDAEIDLTSKDNPSLVFPNGDIKNIISSTYNSNNTGNTFTGNQEGVFISTLSATTNSNQSYELEFSEKTNIVLRQDNEGLHTPVDGEVFILKVFPNDKNITLLNPDNTLLIDTNFDDEYESGITSISTSEIRFKYSVPNSGNASSIEFFANQIEGISFTHSSTNVSQTSTFRGDFLVTCFAKDSDNDGVEDALDLDSDNDGIPDFQESTAQDVSLTNLDTNQDGLDDIFNTIIPNQDTDNDGIHNYLDLDSDNDGIYDIVEAGNENLDVNNDGIIDNANPTTVGTNGLFDALETTPDSGILINPIPNSDATSIIVENQDLFFNFADLDADGDDCFDVIEAGFTGNGFGILNATPFAIDLNGKVINNADGYTSPNLNYINSAPIVITDFIDVTFCEDDTNEIEIQTNADTIQWQFSSDNGLNFTDISEGLTIDGSVFTNVDTSKLNISNTSVNLDNYQFKVVLAITTGNNICPKNSNAITLTVNPKPILLTNLVQLKQCADNAARNTIVNLTEAEKNISTNATINFEYYTTSADAIEGDMAKQITDIENYPVINGTANAWARVISNEGCFDVAEIQIIATFVTDITINTPFEECDDFVDENGDDSENDGITFFDFSSAEQDIKNSPSFADPSIIDVFFYETEQDRDAATNPIPDISRHRNDNNDSYKFEQTIYVKIKNKNNNDCEGIGRLFLKTNATPEFSVDGAAPDDPIIICPKNIPYTLNASTSETYDYIWTNQNGDNLGTNQSIAISDAGEYTVTAFSRNNKNCPSIPKTIVVQKSNFETLSESFITIIDDISGTNSNLSIRIDIPKNPIINEEFQYALEDEKGFIIRAFQNDNIFDDIEGGVYKILVENKNGCGSSELLVSVLQFPKFITPNEDGINDTFIVKGATKDFYSSATINIFNRFGKLVAQEQIDSQGWNGMYNGKLLPPSDYWFDIILTPTDMSKPIISRKGNFSLVRK